jgi:predicted TIM-barrel enzyme
MSKNNKQSTPKVASLAAATLNDKNASQIAKSLAGSVIAQAHSGKQTGAEMESKASKVLQSEKYSDDTKTLAASLVSQSNKER